MFRKKIVEKKKKYAIYISLIILFLIVVISIVRYFSGELSQKRIVINLLVFSGFFISLLLLKFNKKNMGLNLIFVLGLVRIINITIEKNDISFYFTSLIFIIIVLALIFIHKFQMYILLFFVSISFFVKYFVLIKSNIEQLSLMDFLNSSILVLASVISIYLINNLLKTEEKLVNELDLNKNELLHTSNLLKNTEENYRILFEQAPYGIIIYDYEDHSIIDFNKRACEQLGYTQEEFAKLGLKDFVPNLDKILENLDDYILDESVTFHNTHLTKSGKMIETEVSVRKIKIGDKYYVSAIHRDLTEIVKEKEKFRKYVERAPFGIIVVDADGKVMEINKKIIEMLEYSKEELLKLNARDFSTDKDFNETHKKVIKKESSEIIKKLKTKTGKELIVKIKIVKINDDLFLGFHEDITKSIENENKLIESEEKFRNLFENANDGILFAEIDTKKFVLANKAICNMLGYTEKEVLNLSVSEIHPEKDIPKVIETFERQAKKESVIAKNLPVLKKDGKIIFADISSTPVKILDKDYLIGIFRDNTKQKLYEEELIRSKLKAEKANMAKSEFLSNMSHELRTPLNSIIGFSEILRDDEPNDERKEYLNIVYSNSILLLELINEILTLSKIESNSFELKIEKTDIRKICDELAKNYSFMVKGKDIEFKYYFEDSISRFIESSKLFLHRIIHNLLSNSIKFTNKGEIYFGIRKTIKSQKEYLEITVKDTGIGINKEKQEQLFEPFVQGEYFLEKKYQGSGLGLAIVKKLVDKMDGIIEVQTIIDKGTTFKIYLSYEKTEEIIDQRKTQIKNEKVKIRILAAEDNIGSSLLLKKIASKNNWDICIVENGEKLLNEIEKNEYDIVIMDVQMPVLNGIETTKIIRQNKKIADIPIIGISAFGFTEDIEKALDSGMDNYLTKPIIEKDLKDAIMSVFKSNTK